MKKPYLETGKIVGTHGIKGEMRLQPWSDTPQDTASLEVLYLDSEGITCLKIESARVHGNMIILKAEGVNRIEQAEKYRNRVVYADRNDLKLKDGRYFIQDLLGCRVYNVNTMQQYGEICGVSQTGANDVWHVKNERGEDFLIPSIPQVVISTDIDKGEIGILPMEGMFE